MGVSFQPRGCKMRGLIPNWSLPQVPFGASLMVSAASQHFFAIVAIFLYFDNNLHKVIISPTRRSHSLITIEKWRFHFPTTQHSWSAFRQLLYTAEACLKPTFPHKTISLIMCMLTLLNPLLYIEVFVIFIQKEKSMKCRFANRGSGVTYEGLENPNPSKYFPKTIPSPLAFTEHRSWYKLK